MTNNKLIILQTVVPDYRLNLFGHIYKKYGEDFSALAGDEYFAPTVKTKCSEPYFKRIKNHYFLGRKILFQTGMWCEVLAAENVVLELNPRILSNWLILLIRKILFKKTTLWGHAWPASGKDSKSDQIRGIMRSMADNIICYTYKQAEELKQKMPAKDNIYTAPNSLYFTNQISELESYTSKNIIYVGRVTKAKKPEILLKAFAEIIDKLPKDSNLVIIGEGESVEDLKFFASENNIEDRVLFKGHIGDFEILKKEYSDAIASVSPGYVGLSITQSLGFGIPMIISKDENHSPEIECVNEGENAIYFDTDNLESLGEKILSIYAEKEYWRSQRQAIIDHIKTNYTIERMAEPFLKIGGK